MLASKAPQHRSKRLTLACTASSKRESMANVRPSSLTSAHSASWCAHNDRALSTASSSSFSRSCINSLNCAPHRTARARMRMVDSATVAAHRAARPRPPCRRSKTSRAPLTRRAEPRHPVLAPHPAPPSDAAALLRATAHLPQRHLLLLLPVHLPQHHPALSHAHRSAALPSPRTHAPAAASPPPPTALAWAAAAAPRSASSTSTSCPSPPSPPPRPPRPSRRSCLRRPRPSQARCSPRCCRPRPRCLHVRRASCTRKQSEGGLAMVADAGDSQARPL